MRFEIHIFFWTMLQIRKRWNTVSGTFPKKCSFNQQCFIDLFSRNTTPLHREIRQEISDHNNHQFMDKASCAHKRILGLQWGYLVRKKYIFILLTMTTHTVIRQMTADWLCNILNYILIR